MGALNPLSPVDHLPMIEAAMFVPVNHIINQPIIDGYAHRKPVRF